MGGFFTPFKSAKFGTLPVESGVAYRLYKSIIVGCSKICAGRLKLRLFGLAYVLGLVLLCGPGCKPKAPAPQRVVDSSIADTLMQITEPGIAAFDSLQHDGFFALHPGVKSFDAVTRLYYQNRDYKYIWLPQGNLSELAYAMMAHTEEIFAAKGIKDAYGQKLDSLLQTFGTASALPDSQRVLTELLLTARYFTYVDKVVKGAVDESVANKLGWLLPRRKVSLSAMLDSFLTAPNWDTFEKNAINSQYFKLRQALQRYKQLSGSTETVVYWPAAQKGIRAGDSSVLIGRIARRLTELGYLPALPADTLHAGPEIINAVAIAQRAYGLQQDSIIGRSLTDALNVPARERIKTLLVNMERMRWVPERVDAQNLILVNIPDYKLIYYQNGQPVWNCRVVVGSPMHKTVVFSGVMDYVVFSPYWYVPQSIIKNEIGLSRAKSPAYLKRKNMEWSGGSLREKPGPNNSLGRVKFIFPNSNSIYLHDTPAKDLFNREQRAFSHGCIRVGEPFELAKRVLAYDTLWTEERIKAAMAATTEQKVVLKQKVPVYITYFTAFTDAQGLVHFRKDVYNRDEALFKVLVN